jgi:hypothetical protein
MLRSQLLCLLFLTLPVLVSGCRGVDLSSMPLADELGLAEVRPVPEEIKARYGPTAKDRLKMIRKQRGQAKKGSTEVREQISEKLAEQIRAEPNAFLRQEIVRALAECDTPQAAKILRAGLNDENVDVQIQCCRGWGKWGTDESVSVLGEVLDNKHAATDLKIAAIDALQASGRPQGATFLVSLLDKREDPALQYRALEALQKITGQNLLDNQEAWQAYVAEEIEKSLAVEAKRGPSTVDRTFFGWR